MPNSRTTRRTVRGETTARRRSGPRSRRGAVAVEAAVCMPVIVALMLGMWELGRMSQMARIVKDAAREGARVAAGGMNNGTVVTVANVQTAVQNYLTSSGMPATAVNGAVITCTNLSSDPWTNPGNALPLDHFQVSVTIPAGAPFNSLQFVAAPTFGLTQLQEAVDWYSANDAQVVVNTQLPF